MTTLASKLASHHALWQRVETAARAARKAAGRAGAALAAAVRDQGAGQHLKDAAEASEREKLLFDALMDLEQRLSRVEQDGGPES